MTSVLVFSRTKYGADKINHRLERGGIISVAIHSGRTQGQREHAMEGFKGGQYAVMVATDIAARGIDVEGISHVINFDVPAFAEDYIHRIGRTGRATATGDAITLVSPEEEKYLHQIEKFIGCKIPLEKCPVFTQTKFDSPRPQRFSAPRQGLVGFIRDVSPRPVLQTGKTSSPGSKSRFFSRRRRRRRTLKRR